jgi:hypothetical protein
MKLIQNTTESGICNNTGYFELVPTKAFYDLVNALVDKKVAEFKKELSNDNI